MYLLCEFKKGTRDGTERAWNDRDQGLRRGSGRGRCHGQGGQRGHRRAAGGGGRAGCRDHQWRRGRREGRHRGRRGDRIQRRRAGLGARDPAPARRASQALRGLGVTAPSGVRTRTSTTELRVYLPIAGLRRQFAAYLGTPTRARGYPAAEGDHALIIEVAPGLAIERVTDLALRAEPTVEPGILFVERQFGVLEVHSPSAAAVQRAGEAILTGLGRSATDQLKPALAYSDIIEDVTDQQAVIINRSRQASMLLPGQSLLVCEMTPALFAAVAANEAEKVAPENTLVDVNMIGASGRLYIAGTTAGVSTAAAEIERLLASIEGRDHR